MSLIIGLDQKWPPQTMFRQSKSRFITLTKELVPMIHPSPHSANSTRLFVSISNSNIDAQQLDAIFHRKQSLRSKIRKDLKSMDPKRRIEEDDAIQNNVMESPWFKASKRLCAYITCPSLREVDTSRIVSEVLSNQNNDHDAWIRKELYVPRVEDRSSNMRMLKISSVHSLIESSLHILEPALIDSEGNECEDVMQANEPVDLVILPGLAFDRSGRRLGRSGGYYDLFLMKYQKLVLVREWKMPFLVGLAYTPQVLEKEAIPVTPYDVSVDAVVSPDGVIPISTLALERC